MKVLYVDSVCLKCEVFLVYLFAAAEQSKSFAEILQW
jgi:hypothetical protein